MIKKRGVYYHRHNLVLVGIVLVIVLLLLLFVLPPKYKYSHEIFKQEFIKDDFDVINGSAIKFSDIGIEVNDLLLIDGREYKINKEKIEGILIRKESTDNGTKIVYGLRNEGDDKEIQFVWKSNIPRFYDRANNFGLNKDFVTDSQIIKFYSNNEYRSYMTFRDVGKAFGGVGLSYNANTRELIASSNKIRLKKDQEIMMDPGAGIDPIAPLINFDDPTPPNGTITSDTKVEINISIEEENLDKLIWNWNGTNYTFYIGSLVLMMNFDNITALGENNTYVKDLSYSENDGIIHGATYTEGKYGYGLRFDSDDYVDIDDEGSLDLDIFSIEFWFKPDEDYNSSSGYMSLVYEDNYEIYMENGNMVFEYEGNKVNSSTDTWEKDQWYHILVTYDGVQTIYVDGLKEESTIVIAPFTVKNMAGDNVAFFLNSGDIVLRGNCNAGSCSYPESDGFIIQNSIAETVAYIDNDGDLCIEDSNCNDNDANCDNPSNGSFIIKNTDNRIVSYINSTGGLCLIGNLTENGIS